MSKLIKYAEYFLMAEFMKAKLAIFQKENGREGVDFIFKTKSRIYHELYLQTIKIEEKQNVSILKSALGEPKENLWVALVLLMDDIEPVLYLIPSNQLAKPDDYVFLDSEQGERLNHLSSWKIKIFTKGIKNVLNKYRIENQIKNLI